MRCIIVFLLVLFVACDKVDWSHDVLEFYPHYDVNLSVVDKDGNDLFDRNNTYRVFVTLLDIAPQKDLLESSSKADWWGTNVYRPFFYTWMDECYKKINVSVRENTGSCLLDSLYVAKFAEGLHGTSIIRLEHFDSLVKEYSYDDPKNTDVPAKYTKYKLYSISPDRTFDKNMESVSVLKWEMTDNTITTDTIRIKWKLIKYEKGTRSFYDENGEQHTIKGEYQLIDEVFVNGQKLWDLDTDGTLIDYSQYESVEHITRGDILKETPYIVLVK